MEEEARIRREAEENTRRARREVQAERERVAEARAGKQAEEDKKKKEGKREWATLRRPLERIKGPWERVKESEEEKAAREAEMEIGEASRTVEDIAKFKAKATRAEELARLRKAEGGTKFQRLLHDATATGTAGSKFASGVTKVATLGGPIGMKPGMTRLYSSSGMRSMTTPPSPPRGGPLGLGLSGGMGRLYSMGETKIGRVVQPPSAPRQQMLYPTRQLEQQTTSPLRQLSILEGQRLGMRGQVQPLGIGQGRQVPSHLSQIGMLGTQRFGMSRQVQLPRAEQEVLTEISRRGNSEVPNQIVKSLSDMGISRQETEDAIRSLLQKRVIRQSGEKFGNEFVLEISR
mgnify:CR=1 FL=1